jgi:small GTP-binding protein
MTEKEALFSSYTVVVCGDPLVGKSSLITRMAKNHFEERPTAAVTGSMMPMTLEAEGKRVRLMLWDTSGSEECRDLTTCHFENAQACIIVYAVDDPQSVTNILSTWSVLLKGHSKVPHIVMVVGNKSDLPEDQRKVREEWVEKEIQSLDVPVATVSCLDGTGVKEFVGTLASRLIEVFPPPEAPGSKQCNVEILSGSEKPMWKCPCTLL